MGGPSKKTLSVRDQLFEQVKENLHNPKKLNEIKQQNMHVRVDFNQLIHQAKVHKMKNNKPTEQSSADQEVLKRIDQSLVLLDRLRAVKPRPAYADSVL